MLQNAASEAFDNKYYVSNTVSKGAARSCLCAVLYWPTKARQSFIVFSHNIELGVRVIFARLPLQLTGTNEWPQR